MTSLNPAADSTATPDVTPTLRSRAIRSSVWTTFGFGFHQCFRFVSNLILAYLIAPEAFGVMALVNMAMTLLQMFSDLGIGPNIIHSKRGVSPVFLNTAWTVQVIRGFVLWVVACLLAWPLAQVFNAQMLTVMPVVGLNAVIMGFNSTRLFTLNRKLTIGRITMLKTASQVVGMIAMVAFAYFVSRSVWALVVNGLVASAILMIGSHTLIPGERNRFAMDRSALGELITFGRWVFFSTILTALANHVETPMMELTLGTTMLGIYWIAFNLAELGPMLVNRLGNVVGFPALAELYRRDVKRFHYQLKRMRLMLVLPINALLLTMVFLGPPFVLLVYPTEFANASWMLLFIVIGSLAGMVNSTYGHAFFAMGSTWRVMVVVASQLVLKVIGCAVGWYFLGAFGFLFGLTATHWLLYPVYARLAITLGIWHPRIDLPILLGCGVAPGLWIVIERMIFPA